MQKYNTANMKNNLKQFTHFLNKSYLFATSEFSGSSSLLVSVFMFFSKVLFKKRIFFVFCHVAHTKMLKEFILQNNSTKFFTKFSYNMKQKNYTKTM